MKKVIFLFIFSLFWANHMGAQATLINPAKLLRPGTNATFLITNGSGSVVYSNAQGILTAGTGISISGNTITNSSPDQTVALTGAGITAVTGTYPNFTITSTEVDGSVANEGSLTVAAGTGTTSIINSNTSGQTGVTLTAGTGMGISESGNVITLINSSPDQTVALTGGGTVSITGTYPNFTVTGNAQTITAGDGSGNDRTITLSASGGTITLAQGSGITLTRSGQTITIASSASAPTITIQRYEEVPASNTSTITVSGFTPLTTDTMVFLDGVHMDWGAGEDVTLSGSTITFASAILAGQKVLVKKIAAN